MVHFLRAEFNRVKFIVDATLGKCSLVRNPVSAVVSVDDLEIQAQVCQFPCQVPSVLGPFDGLQVYAFLHHFPQWAAKKNAKFSLRRIHSFTLGSWTKKYKSLPG